MEWRSSRLRQRDPLVVAIDATHRLPGVTCANGSLDGPAGQTDYRVLVIALWWPMLLTAIVPGLWVMRAFERQKRRERDEKQS